MNNEEFNLWYPHFEQQFVEGEPDLVWSSHDTRMKNKEELLEASQQISFGEFANGDFGLIIMDPPNPEKDVATILFKVNPLGKDKQVVPENGMRITVEESAVKGVENDKDYILQGASIGTFMTKKGEFKRDCNLILTPVKYLDKWDVIDRFTDDDIEKFVNAGVLEVRNGQMMAVDTASESVVTPLVTSVCRIDVNSEIMHTFHWMSSSSLESES